MSCAGSAKGSVKLRCVCVCLLPVRAKAKIKGNKYGATRSAGDYRRKVQLARLCGDTPDLCNKKIFLLNESGRWSLLIFPRINNVTDTPTPL